jgi:hypothetical protein
MARLFYIFKFGIDDIVFFPLVLRGWFLVGTIGISG